MRVYLAGPMRGIPGNNSLAFAQAAKLLRGQGHEVWSPSEHDEELGVGASNASIGSVFARDLHAVCTLEAVVLLPGWRKSHGAVLERHAADVTRKRVFELVGQELRPLPPIDWRLADL